ALFGVSIVLGILTNDLDSSSPDFFDFLSAIVGIILAPAIILTQLRSVKEKEISVTDAVKGGWPFVIRIFFLQLLTVVAVVVGLIFLIVPGVIIFQRLLLTEYYLVDKNMGVIEAMKASFADSGKSSGAV